MKNISDIPAEAKKYLSKKMIEFLFTKNRIKGFSKDKAIKLAFSELQDIINKK